MTDAIAPYQHNWDRYAAVAAALHKGRVEGYPRLVEGGRLDPDEADRRIAIMAAAAEIWRAAWNCTLPDPMIVGTFDRCDIIGELADARASTARRLAADPSNGGAAYQVECLDEMIAWHRRWTDGPLFCVRLTLQIRAGIADRTARRAA
ncbi:hypothetical protein [Sphingomonas sp. YL-JM2C]